MLEVAGEPAPQEMDHAAVAVLARDAGAADLDRLALDVGGEARQLELARGVEAVPLGVRARHQAVRADDGAAVLVDDHQVVAERIVGGAIEPALVGGAQALVELEVEDLEAKALHLGEIGFAPREAQTVAARV